MYFVDSPKLGLDLELTPRNDGLKAKVQCQSCGLKELAIFHFLRFESEPLTQPEIGAIFDATRALAQRRHESQEQSEAERRQDG